MHKLLDDKHRDELQKSGLSDETIEASGIYSASNGEIKKILGWQPRTHSWGRGMVIPFDRNDLEGYRRVKLDYPRHDDHKCIKYESPKGAPNRAYFPPGFNCAEKGLLLITEGEKKAMAAQQAGFQCIGLVGVYGFQQRRIRDDGGRPVGKVKLIPDLTALNWSNRDVVIVFDSDAEDNRDIQFAEARLSELLAKAGASVRIARIPAHGKGKVGIDDFLVTHGDRGSGELRRILDAAIEAEKPDTFGPMDWARAIVHEHFGGEDAPTIRWWRDEFWRWTGTRWERVPLGELRPYVLRWLEDRKPRTTPRYANDVADSLKAVVPTPYGLNMPNFIGIDGGAKPTDIIACGNGLLDISNIGADLKFAEHTPCWFSPTSLNYDFDPEAKCEAWERFLEVSLSKDRERIALLQEWFGLMLTSDTSYQKLLLMVGPKRSGKGTITRTLQEVVGQDNCTSPTLSSLGGSFGLWQLLGKTLATMPDAHLSHRADSIRTMEAIKSIVGEDALNIDRKNLPVLQNVRLGTRFVITVNELPHFSDASGALTSRLLVLPFDKSFIGSEDRGLEQTLKNEASGILNWSLKGLYRLRENGRFQTPKASAAILNNFSRMTSPTSAFIEDCCVVGLNNSVSCRDIYDAWSEWAEQNGQKPGSDSMFGEKLRAVHPDIRRTRPRADDGRIYVYEGIELNPDGCSILNARRARS